MRSAERGDEGREPRGGCGASSPSSMLGRRRTWSLCSTLVSTAPPNSLTCSAWAGPHCLPGPRAQQGQSIAMTATPDCHAHPARRPREMGMARQPAAHTPSRRPFGYRTMPRLVVDDREASALEVRKTLAHGLQLLGRVAHPVHELTDDLDGLSSAIGPGGIARELLVRHVGVVLQ